MEEKTDAELVNLTLTQGSQYFGQLVKRYSDYLFGLGMRLTAGNHHLSHDLAQTTFLKAFQYLSSFDPNVKNAKGNEEFRFKNWLTRITINSFNDICNENRTSQNHEDEREIIDNNSTDGDNNDFFRLIKPLTSEQRTLVTLKFVYEYTNQEIADLMSLKLGTVKSRLN